MKTNNSTYLPPEWHHHSATWLSWPHNLATWPIEIIGKAQKEFSQFIALISISEPTYILVPNESSIKEIEKHLSTLNHKAKNIAFHIITTNDAWIRDYGPDFVLHNNNKTILNWKYNAWGGKYPPFDSDNDIPNFISKVTNLPKIDPNFILEGGSIEVNGKGTLLTTKECLLHPNRNPGHSKTEIEKLFQTHYGVNEVIWLSGNLTGDDTDGHIDNIARFVNENTIVCGWETDAKLKNQTCFEQNLNYLKLNYPQFELVKLPMPPTYILNGQQLPASYLNFYIVNNAVIVPQYGFSTDQIALKTLTSLFPNRRVIGLSSKSLIWGQGSFHCLSKHEASFD